VSGRAASLRLLARTLVRAAVLAVLALAGWGTLLLLVTLGNAVTRGPRVALALLLPSPGATGWGWVGVLSAGLALLSGAGFALFVALARRPPKEPSPAAPPPPPDPSTSAPPSPAPSDAGTPSP